MPGSKTFTVKSVCYVQIKFPTEEYKMNITIIKKTNCGKVSTPYKESLTYNVGQCGDEYYFRVTDNVGGGFFSS